MLGSVKELARTLLSFAETRARLAATELEEQAARLAEILIWAAAALFFFAIAVLFAAVLVVLLFWDSNRLLAAGLLAALFAGIAAFAALAARARLRERPKFLAATLAELKQDRERIAGP
ncbi:MAG: phage holin family protein [Burkholderiales bacterium]|nr:phage holin family protein [Burkholderiales bacterium]